MRLFGYSLALFAALSNAASTFLCSTKFMYGFVEAGNISEQINGFKCVNEGGTENTAIIKLKLCGEDVELEFTERHIVNLQEILKSAGKL